MFEGPMRVDDAVEALLEAVLLFEDCLEIVVLLLSEIDDVPRSSWMFTSEVHVVYGEAIIVVSADS